MPIKWGKFPMEYDAPSIAQGTDAPATFGDHLLSLVAIQKHHAVSIFAKLRRFEETDPPDNEPVGIAYSHTQTTKTIFNAEKLRAIHSPRAETGEISRPSDPTGNSNPFSRTGNAESPVNSRGAIELHPISPLFELDQAD